MTLIRGNPSTDRIRVTCYPSSAIPQYGKNWFAGEDRFGDLLGRDTGESPGSATTGFPELSAYNRPNSWAGQRELTTLDECEYILINAEGGRVYEGGDALARPKYTGSVFGIILKHREEWCDCVMSPPTDGAPSATPIISKTIHWQQVSGTGYETRRPRMRPKVLRVMCVKPTVDSVSIIRSQEGLLKNESHRIDFGFSDSVSTSGGYAFYTLGDGAFGFLLLENHYPALLSLTGTAKTLRSFRELGKVHFQGPGKLERASLSIRHIAGWMILGMSVNSGHEQVFSIANPQPAGPVNPGSPNQPDTILPAMSWPAGRVQLESYGVRVSLGFAGIGYSYDPIAEGRTDQLVGTISRTLFIQQPPAAGTLQGTGVTKGWALNGAGTDVKSTYEQTGTGGSATYICKLMASATYLGVIGGQETFADGVETPFVSSVKFGNTPTVVEPSATGFDITNFCKGVLRIKSARPPAQVSRTMSFTVDRDGLDNPDSLIRGALGGRADWESFVHQFRLVRVEFSEDSGSTWNESFYGYIHTPVKSAGGANQGLMTLQATDQLYRFAAPHAVVDAPAHDLAWLAVENQADLFGVDCFQQLLTWALGVSIASLLNGGDLRQFYASGWPPILNGANDRSGWLNGLGSWWLSHPGATPQTVSNNQEFLPPSWFSGYNEWANHISQRADFGMIYYWDRLPGTTGGSSVPIYGDPIVLELAARNVDPIELFYGPNTYAGHSVRRAIRDIQTTFLPDRNINTAVFIGVAPEEPSALIPYAMRGEARLADNDTYNSPAETWVRKTVEQDDLFYMVGSEGLRRLASRFIGQFANRQIRDISITAMGSSDYALWQIVRPHTNLSTDSTIGVDNTSLLVKAWEQVWNFDAPGDPWRWTTELSCRDLTAGGL